MDIYVKELDTGRIFQFPMLPTAIEVKAETRFIKYDIMTTGEVQLPLGEELTRFSWSGILPGEPHKNEPYVCMDESGASGWVDPKHCQEVFSSWRATGKKLLLTATETTINHSVHLEDYTCNYTGAFGDIEYTINFAVAKDIIIEIEGKESKGAAGGSTAAPSSAPKKTAKTYTVKPNDSLWSISQKQLGDGNRWKEIYNLNKAEIDKRNKGTNLPYATIYSGQVFNLPS